MSIAEVPKGAMVAVANDPVNQGRGLLLAEAAVLITLKAGVSAGTTIDNIAANPRKLKFLEIEGPQLVRAISDIYFTQGYQAYYVNADRGDFAAKARPLS